MPRIVFDSPDLQAVMRTGTRPDPAIPRIHRADSLNTARRQYVAGGGDTTPKGPFSVTLEGGTAIRVSDTSGGNGAGLVTIGSISISVPVTDFAVQTGEVYLDVTYTGGTVSAYSADIRIAASTPTNTSYNQFVLRLGGCTVSGGTSASVYQTRAPGDVEVLGRWVV